MEDYKRVSYGRTRRINKKYFYILKNRPTFDSKTNIVFHRYRGLFSKTRIDGGGAIESNDGRNTCVPSVRASRNYFDPWTSSVANRIYLWVYNESRYRTRISIEENSFISGSAISSNHLVVCSREQEFDFTAVKYSRWISERENGLEIRRSGFPPR